MKKTNLSQTGFECNILLHSDTEYNVKTQEVWQSLAQAVTACNNVCKYLTNLGEVDGLEEVQKEWTLCQTELLRLRNKFSQRLL